MNEKISIEWDGYEIMQNEIFVELYCKYKNFELLKIDNTISYLHKLPIFGYTIMKIHSPDSKNILSIIQKSQNICKEKKVASFEIITPYKDKTIEKYIVNNGGSFIMRFDENEDHIWNNIEKSARQQIRQSKKNGVTIEQVKNDMDFNIWWKIYESAFKTKKFAGQPYDLVYELFKNSNIGCLFVVKFKKEIIAGEFILYDKAMLEWLSAYDLRFSKCHAINLLTWELIQWGKEQGYSYLDMGGAILNRNHGPTIFKKKFGAEYKPLYTYRIPIAYLKHIMVETALKLYKS